MSDISSLKFIWHLFQICSQSASMLHILGISHQMVWLMNREYSSLDCHLVLLFWWHSTIFSWNKEHRLSANDVMLQFWEKRYYFMWNPLLLPEPEQRWKDNKDTHSAKKNLPAALYTLKVLSSQWPSSSYLEQHGKQCDCSQVGCRGSVRAITMSRFIIPPTTNSVRGFGARQVWRLIL